MVISHRSEINYSLLFPLGFFLQVNLFHELSLYVHFHLLDVILQFHLLLDVTQNFIDSIFMYLTGSLKSLWIAIHWIWHIWRNMLSQFHEEVPFLRRHGCIWWWMSNRNVVSRFLKTGYRNILLLGHEGWIRYGLTWDMQEKLLATVAILWWLILRICMCLNNHMQLVTCIVIWQSWELI